MVSIQIQSNIIKFICYYLINCVLNSKYLKFEKFNALKVKGILNWSHKEMAINFYFTQYNQFCWNVKNYCYIVENL
jgi:hypothetical protein